MIVLRDPTAVDQVQSAEMRVLLRRRFDYLSEEDPYDPETMAFFVVVEPGDDIAAINAELGFDILRNRFTDIRFDEEGFHPSFEVLEEHRTCFEIVFVLSDDGFGAVVFVPKDAQVHPALLELCTLHSVPSQEETGS